MNILSIGSFEKLSNTCLHRHWALIKLANNIDKIELYRKKLSLHYKIANRLFQRYYIPIQLPDENKANKIILKHLETTKYDLVWIDKGLTINASTLKKIKRKYPETTIISYTADNMSERHNQSQNFLKCIPIYDYHITTKSNIISKLKTLGAKKVIFTNQSFEDSFHYQYKLTDEEKRKLGGDVGFIGMWEKERFESISFLAQNGIKVKVYGDAKWQEYKNHHSNLTVFPALFSEDYSKALQAFKISLCFLRKMNNDQHTSRTMEIPACGGFMLAERTTEHLSLFEEGVEAEYFSSNQELLEKCKYYLNHNEKRNKIVKQGTIRCKQSGYSNLETIKKILSSL